MSQPPLRVRYCDPDPLAADTLVSLLVEFQEVAIESLSEDPSTCDLGSIGADADVVLVDVGFRSRGGDGIEVARSVRDAQPGCTVAVCAARVDRDDAARAWSLGIRAYFAKHSMRRSPAHFVTLLLSIGDGAVVYHLDPRSGAVPNPLTARETDILQRKVRGQRHRDIAADLYLSVRTIDSHLAHAREKVGADSMRHLIDIALRRGYIAGLSTAVDLAQTGSRSESG